MNNKKQSKNALSHIEFNEEPYTTNGKYQVFIPKERDPVLETIRREREQMKLAQQQRPTYTVHNSENEVQEDDNQYQQSANQDVNVEVVDAQKNLFYPQSPSNTVPYRVKSPSGIYRINRSQYTSPTSQMQRSQSQKNFSIKSSSKSNPFGQTLFKSKQMSQLKESLYFDERTKTVPKSTIKNQIIEDIVREGDLVLKNDNLLNSIYKLKSLNLLKKHDMNVNRFPGVGKVSFVFNDYHSKSTNSGYSRNFGGVFFTR